MDLLDKYYRISEAAGISINTLPDGSTAINLCSVKAVGNELNIDKKIFDLYSVDQLSQHLPGKSYIAINLNGKAVLHKKVSRLEKIAPGNFSQVIPNAKFDDFYVQHFISGESSFVSVIRKTEADRWIDKIKALGFKPLMLSLGPFPLFTIMPQLNIYDGNFIVDGHVIERGEQACWTGYRYDSEQHTSYPLKIADEKIDEALILPYATAFQLVMSAQAETIHTQADSTETVLTQKLSEVKLKVHGFIILVFFFMALLSNYVFLSWLSASNGKLIEQAAVNSESINNANELTAKVKNKEMRVAALGWENGVRKSSLIDQVCLLLPQEITLSSIAVDPIDQASSRIQKSEVFFSRKIQITGNSGQIIPVNEWIARIKTRRWVKNVQMDSYTFDNELNTGRFRITIVY